MKWNRQDRLRLLRAFPEDGLGSPVRRLRQEEERALPNTEDRSGGIRGGIIGGRIIADEMAFASDREILKLIDDLPDGTEWHRSARIHDLEPARAGGARELAHEFSKFAQAHPERASRLIEQLHPRRHEVYAGAGLRGLAQSEFPTARLIDLIYRLNQRSFTSRYFREDAAYALEKVAERVRWLPQGSLQMLEEWLDKHQEPTLPSEVQTEQKSRESRRDPILFRGGHWLVPGGRSTILAAIATGYLKQQPPDLDNWVRVIQHRLHHEQHPGIWTETIIRMPVLFQGDVIRATQVYDSVFQAHPEILQNAFVLHSIARIIGWFQPKEKLQEWLNQLWFEGLEFCHQAYGEMLFLYYWCYGDTWSQELIDKSLAEQTDEDVLLGLAYGASKFWHKSDCRAISTEILCTLASHSSRNIQTAVADVFRLNWKNFQLNLKMKRIIQAVCNNPPVLLETARYLMEMLEPLTGQEPALVSQACQTLLQTCSSEIGEPTQRLYPLAEILTSVSLTLHRQGEFREAGLQIFEQLVALNLREARVALEILDRKPIQLVYSVPRRRRWRRQIS
jgi:hypothetical protein